MPCFIREQNRHCRFLLEENGRRPLPNLVHSNETLVHNNINSIYRLYFTLNSYKISYLRSTCVDNCCTPGLAEMHREALYGHLVEEYLE